TAAGWQQLNFFTPVAISANVTYIASYHTSGGFSFNSAYFQNQGADSPPLHALKNGVDGPNGVYVYGPGGIFPNQTYQSGNYWADVLFVPITYGPPQSVAALAGTPQSTPVLTAFVTTLQMKVTDSDA